VFIPVRNKRKKVIGDGDSHVLSIIYWGGYVSQKFNSHGPHTPRCNQASTPVGAGKTHNENRTFFLRKWLGVFEQRGGCNNSPNEGGLAQKGVRVPGCGCRGSRVSGGGGPRTYMGKRPGSGNWGVTAEGGGDRC